MFTLWKKEELVNADMGSASLAKRRLLNELRTERIPYNVQMMKEELARLLAQRTDIKDNIIEIVKTPEARSLLKIKCRCS